MWCCSVQSFQCQCFQDLQITVKQWKVTDASFSHSMEFEFYHLGKKGVELQLRVEGLLIKQGANFPHVFLSLSITYLCPFKSVLQQTANDS